MLAPVATRLCPNAVTKAQFHASACANALSLKPPKEISGMKVSRRFSGKKAFQYNWYMRILNSTKTSPLLILYHNDFKSERLVQLRRDVTAASNRLKQQQQKRAQAAGIPVEETDDPLLTVIRSSIFGAAIRDFPALENAEVEPMVENVSGSLAVLSLPVLDPPQLKAILRTFERSAPPRKPKTPEELKKEEQEKNADPANPGKRMKRMRQVVDPELKVLGAFFDGQVLLPARVKQVADMPTLQTLREQLLGLLSAPGTQLAMTLSAASGGRLARTLEGLKKGLEESAGEAPAA